MLRDHIECVQVCIERLLCARYFKGEGVLQDYVTAYMWLTLSAANGQAKSAKYRDLVAQVLSPAEITEAQCRARDCMASAYQDCN